MKILVIGGSGFIGPFIVRELTKNGHEVTVLHRGMAKPALPDGVRVMLGDRNHLEKHRLEFEQAVFDAVVDVILSSEKQARGLLETFAGITGRIVALSSQDVYRAYGVLVGIDEGPPQQLPLTEESELRTKPPYPSEHARKMQAIFSWLDEDYDKVRVERVLNSSAQTPVTILRLPMVYGPGDPLHRLYPMVKRINDGRETLIVDANVANLHSPRGYVEDVAHAVALATLSEKAVGRTYNVIEEEAFTEDEWMMKVVEVAGAATAVRVLPTEKTPPYLRVPVKNRQDWIVSGAKIRTELEYRETMPREEALRRTIEWERDNPPSVPMAVFDYAAEDAALAGAES
jgi:nucleoside-diphosphate-sugar epimerase